MAACHVERSETSLISAAEERFKDNLEILRFAQNDIDARVVKHASSPPRDRFAVANLNCSAWLPACQPDELVLWRAYRFRRQDVRSTSQARMPELRATFDS